MQSSNAPNKIQLPFAASGTKNTIPVPSQQGVTPGAASFTDGFPPLTFTPLSAGGVPPAGADFNGVLNAITAVQQWQSAGGCFQYDSTLSTAIGGYPKGSVLLNAAMNGYWISTAENNTTNPDSGGAGWVALASAIFLGGSQVFTASGTFTVPAILQSGAKQAWVTVIGGGGGAGSMYATGSLGGGGGGGGGGGIAEGYVNLSGVSTVAVTVGNGGAGAPATTSGSQTADGVTGGTSSFGSYMSATGGAGGQNWGGGSCGVGIGGCLNTGYNPGESAARHDATLNPQYRGGSGGGPGAIRSGSATPGNNATIPGGGGGGGYPSYAGGAGAPGIVIVRW